MERWAFAFVEDADANDRFKFEISHTLILVTDPRIRLRFSATGSETFQPRAEHGTLPSATRGYYSAYPVSREPELWVSVWLTYEFCVLRAADAAT